MRVDSHPENTCDSKFDQYSFSQFVSDYFWRKVKNWNECLKMQVDCHFEHLSQQIDLSYVKSFCENPALKLKT